MAQQHWYFSFVPVANRLAALDFLGVRKPRLNPVKVVFVGVKHEQRLSGVRVSDLFQRVQLRVVDVENLAVFVVHRAVRHLGEFV